MSSGRSSSFEPISESVVRNSLWAAICLAAEQLAHSCSMFMHAADNGQREKVVGHGLPTNPTWRLVEALSLLGILLRADSVKANEVTLFGSTGHLGFVEEDAPRFLWVQRGLDGDYSALRGRPDIVVTDTSDPPTAQNIVRVVEVKARKSLGASDIRAEFGKAYDLRVQSYFIWTYHTPRPAIVAGANGLGLDLQALGFDSHHGKALAEQPGALLSKVANALDQSRRARRFASGVQRANEEIRLKLSATTR